jgi:dihydroorotate dehydrogenase
MTFLYERILRPLLFRFDPETAHGLAVAWLKVLGSPPARPIVKAFMSVRDPALRVTAAGLDFPSPLGMAAGFDKDGEFLPGLEALGFGFLEAGTLTPRPQPGNDKPRLFRFPSAEAIVNRMGFNNAGASAVSERFARRRPRLGVPLGFNIGKNKATPNERAAEDYLSCLETLFPFADFFVVNVSSPNTPGLRDLQTPSEMEPLMKALSLKAGALASAAKRTRPPLFIKISPDEDVAEATAEIALKTGFAGIVATNTTQSRDGLPAEAPSDGGMSGRPLFAKSTEILRKLFRASQGRLTLIGAGGVFSARDAYEKILAGASLVEAYTGFIYRGPLFAKDLHQGLVKLLRSDGFSSVRDAVGQNS